ncbi:MAG: histidine phosphatase family protein [Candidatus Spechtbacterales bacterium]
MGCLSKLVIVRHGESKYNALKKIKENDPLYKQFRASYDRDWQSLETRTLALAVKQKFFLGVSQHYTPITEEGKRQARVTGANLKREMLLPDAVFVSPSPRTRDTFECIKEGWPELAEVGNVYFDERIREQEHGLLTLFNDSKVFFALNPWQRDLHDLDGEYFFKFPNGENVPATNLRVGLWFNEVKEKFARKVVLVVSHHRAILSMRTVIEGLSPEEFVRIDRDAKPLNCGVTVYKKVPVCGKSGRLALQCYNKKLYDDYF